MFLLILTLTLIFTTSFSKNDKPVLKFNSNGTFKIVQITDVHWRESLPNKKGAIQVIGELLDAEKPDLVMLTGDIISSEQTSKDWEEVLQPIIERKIPWSFTSGNHDSEYNMSTKEIITMLKKMPYSLVEIGPRNIAGYGNSVIPVKSSNGNSIASVLYVLDSHSKPQIEGIGNYGWIEDSQIKWYKKQSKNFTKKNNNEPLPALAFFHIPLPEYNEVVKNPKTVGSFGEPVCAPAYNTGMFKAMKESKDVMGVFVGHDHNNDYIGVLDGIALAYGRISGFDDVRALQRGARVIEMTENKRVFDTWIRTGSGNTIDKVTYPSSF
jgi:predicted MPP superfamily phosphohydrolase